MKSKTKAILSVFAALIVLGAGVFAYFYFIHENAEIREHRLAVEASYEFRSNLTHEDFLYDIEYMIAYLEAQFPFFDIIYQKHGVDLNELGARLRNYIAYEAQDLDWDSFFELIYNEYIAYARQAGHLDLLDAEERWDRIARNEYFISEDNITSLRASEAERILEVLNSSASILGYGPPEQEQSQPAWSPLISTSAAFTTEIIEAGRVASLTLNWLPHSLTQPAWQTLTRFYNQIENFEHLIIDIRNVQGDYSEGWFFYWFVISVLIDFRDTVAIDLYFLPTEENMQHMRQTYGLFPRMPGTHGLNRELGHLTLMNYSASIEPFDSAIPFGGQIWLLVDESVTSEAQFAAHYAKNIGFATLVGETTGGVFGNISGQRQVFALPRTGIIVQYDNAISVCYVTRIPIELGVEPHIFNRDGMDALETVLALIEEGNY